MLATTSGARQPRGVIDFDKRKGVQVDSERRYVSALLLEGSTR